MQDLLHLTLSSTSHAPPQYRVRHIERGPRPPDRDRPLPHPGPVLRMAHESTETEVQLVEIVGPHPGAGLLEEVAIPLLLAGDRPVHDHRNAPGHGLAHREPSRLPDEKIRRRHEEIDLVRESMDLDPVLHAPGSREEPL